MSHKKNAKKGIINESERALDQLPCMIVTLRLKEVYGVAVVPAV